MNRNRIFNGLSALLLVMLSFSSPWALDKGRPRMLINNPVYDAGKIMQGETVTHIYSVKNLGEMPLEIKGVSPG